MTAGNTTILSGTCRTGVVFETPDTREPTGVSLSSMCLHRCSQIEELLNIFPAPPAQNHPSTGVTPINGS